MKLKETKSITADITFDIYETKKAFILRESRNIRIIDKRNFTEIENFPIELDGVMGYKKLQFNSEVIFFTAHTKYDPENTFFGKPDYVELVAISKGEIRWKRELIGWTGLNNYGGFHCVNDFLVVQTIINGITFLHSINPATGEDISQINFPKRKDDSISMGGKQTSIVIKDFLLCITDEALLKIEVSTNSLIATELYSESFGFMTKSRNSIITIIEGTPNKAYEVVIFDLNNLRKTKNFPLNSVEYISDIEISENGKYLLLANENNFTVTLIDIEDENVCWVNKTDKFEIPEKVLFDHSNNPFILKFGEKANIEILNLQSGECVKTINKDSWIESPYFTKDGKLLYVSHKTLHQYEITEDKQFTTKAKKH